MTIDDWLGLRWEDGGQPLIEPPRFSPVVADPTFLFPEESPDGTWALFAHSAWGVHRHSSSDGVAWKDHGLVVRNAMRPFIRKLEPGSAEDGQARYILLYEKYPPLALPLTALPFKRPWRSVLAMQESSDLRMWSTPRTVLEPTLSWMRDATLGQAVSNPCLVEYHAAAPPAVPQSDSPADPAAIAQAWRLYFSAGLAYIEDCGFNEPKYIGVATGPGPVGPFAPLPDPLLGPGLASGSQVEHGAGPGTGTAIDQNTCPELGAGSMKVIRLDDGWLGLQNRIYRDDSGEEGRSRSAIFVLRSEDGLSWRPAMDLPLIAPAPGNGWKSSHVYACDCRFREADGRWYLYFNARDGWSISEGRERIGRVMSIQGPPGCCPQSRVP
jgi:hypothetical protein